MLYYKIPIVDGGFDYPDGCILCCAYPYDGHMYCKFERVTTIGSDWVSITESEFNVRCPNFPTPAEPPVQEIIATSAKLADASIVLDLPAEVDTGTLVKFVAPCACSDITGGIMIDGVTYAVVDALGNAVNGIGNIWVAGAMVAVMIDMASQKAYIQNGAGSSRPNDSIVELWKNASPSSTFAAQTLELDLSNCIGIFVRYKGTKSGSGYYASGFIPMAAQTIMQAITSSGKTNNRAVKANTTGIVFYDGKAEGDVTDGTVIIPVTIYGVKGVLA